MKKVQFFCLFYLCITFPYISCWFLQKDSRYGSLRAPVLLTPATDDRPYKIIEDDRVVIIRNGERYDVTGKNL